MKYIHSEANVFINTPTPVLEAELSGVSPGGKVDLFSTKRFEYDPICDIDWSQLAPNVDQDGIKEQYDECGYGFNLKVGLQSSQDVKSVVIDSCLHQAGEMGFSCTTIYLPGLDVDEATFDKQATLVELRPLRVKELKLRLTEHGVIDWSMMIEKEDMVQALADAMEKRFMREDNNSSLFHRNSKGEVVFTEREAELASDFIATANIEGRVKASLQKKRFVLPQQTHKANVFFCNESVYGTLNMVSFVWTRIRKVMICLQRRTLKSSSMYGLQKKQRQRVTTTNLVLRDSWRRTLVGPTGTGQAIKGREEKVVTWI